LPEAKVSIPDLLSQLATSENGLSSPEAARRLQENGPNEILEKKRSRIMAFLHYFWGPIPGMIEAAAVISGVIQHWDDFTIIVLLLAVNAVVGFWEENKASNEIDLLKKRLALQATALRDGKWVELPARELVLGDVIRLRLGNIVPADARLLDGDYLLVDQSALTGESLPVEKHQGDLAYASSITRQGEMNAVVVAAGMGTYFGKTTKLVEEAETKSHFQKAIVRIGDYLVAIAIVLVTITTLVGLYRQLPPLDLLQFGLVLLVAAIPAAMPAVLSVSMAVGAEALAKKQAIVSKLVAIEEMAGVDILCADKTGTITKNQLTVGEVRPLGIYTQNDVIVYAALASREEDKDPIDDAVIAKARGEDGDAERIAACKVANFKPFDPVNKRTEATVKTGSDQDFRVSKGAPQAVLQLVEANGDVTVAVNQSVDEFATKGFRALGVARTDGGGGWRYVGLIALYDPPREDSAATIATAESMGMKVKMVTGDHIAIAKEVSNLVGLHTNIVTPAWFVDKPDNEAEAAVEGADGFAEVFPEHKYRIIDLLQKKDHIVCMTGDGVNDAPALKKADAGIAVAGATDAARSAADVVLTSPGLSVIIDAVKESRKIFQRMINYATYRIAETIRVLVFITLSIIVFQFYPVTALMIVLLAILNDMPIMTIAYDNVTYSSEPERWNMRTLLNVSTFLGAIGVVSSFLLLYIGIDVLRLSTSVIQSFIFLKLAVAGHLTLFVARTKGPFWSVKPGKSLFVAVMLTKVVALLMTVYGIFLPAIGWNLALLVLGYSLVWFFVQDFLKVRFYRLLNSRAQSKVLSAPVQPRRHDLQSSS
jgi:H+-transporting ATPase